MNNEVPSNLSDQLDEIDSRYNTIDFDNKTERAELTTDIRRLYDELKEDLKLEGFETSYSITGVNKEIWVKLTKRIKDTISIEVWYGPNSEKAIEKRTSPGMKDVDTKEISDPVLEKVALLHRTITIMTRIDERVGVYDRPEDY